VIIIGVRERHWLCGAGIKELRNHTEFDEALEVQPEH